MKLSKLLEALFLTIPLLAVSCFCVVATADTGQVDPAGKSDANLKLQYAPADALRQEKKFDELLKWLVKAKPEMRANFRFAFYQACARYGKREIQLGDYWAKVCKFWMTADGASDERISEVSNTLALTRKFWLASANTRTATQDPRPIIVIPGIDGGSGGIGAQEKREILKALSPRATQSNEELLQQLKRTGVSGGRDRQVPAAE